MTALIFLSGCQCAGGAGSPVGQIEAQGWGRGDAVCVQNKCVRVKLARTAEERQQGLKFIRQMPVDAGMLFVFELSSPHTFWMKETLIPLDMIWLDESRRVIAVADHVPPCIADPCPSYGPDVPIRYVLELNAGQAKALGFTIGEDVEFRLPN